MDSVKQRIDKAMEIAGYENRSSFSKFVKVSYPTMNKWIERNKITDKGINTITKSVRISKSYLETGEGEAELKKDKGLEDLTEEELIALLPKDQQVLIQSYRKLSDDKKKEHRDKLLIEASEAEISDE